MIDLHCHLLPGIDDGARDLEMSLAMARAAAADGISVVACTPHIMPGMYPNRGPDIRQRVAALDAEVRKARINVSIVEGADVHVAPDLPEKLRNGEVLALGGTRYFLFEPPHHVVPPRIEQLVKRSVEAGYVPILTHPERLTWIAQSYDVVETLNQAGCLIQVTAGAVTGAFGQTAQKYARMLAEDGRIDIIASDAHNLTSRPPMLSKAVEAMANWVGESSARAMVLDTPAAILRNREVVPAGKDAPRRGPVRTKPTGGWMRRMLGKGGA